MGKIEAMQKEIELFKVEEEGVAEEMEAVQQRALFTSKEIEKERQMIMKAQAILARAEPSLAADNGKFTVLVTKNIILHEQEATRTKELEETRIHLANTISIAEEELKKQAAANAEENK